jgi:hypothetical protein
LKRYASALALAGRTVAMARHGHGRKLVDHGLVESANEPPLRVIREVARARRTSPETRHPATPNSQEINSEVAGKHQATLAMPAADGDQDYPALGQR